MNKGDTPKKASPFSIYDIKCFEKKYLQKKSRKDLVVSNLICNFVAEKCFYFKFINYGKVF